MLQNETKQEGGAIQLTDGQEKALKAMLDWAENPIKSTVLLARLEGSAGTGKTTLVKEFIKAYKFNYSLCVTAPTHQAKKVIAKITNKPAETIQKLLGLRPNMDIETLDITKPIFEATADKEIRYYKLVILDESSMVNSDLFTLLKKEAREYRVKILFIADRRQLPPVKEKISRVFEEVKEEFVLTEVVRQKGSNPIGPVLKAMMDDIDNLGRSAVNMLRETKHSLTEQGEGYKFISNKDDFTREVLSHFSSKEFEEDPSYCKMAAWTNRTVSVWNDYIRKHIAKSNNQLVIGDLLKAYNSVVDEYQDIVIANSEEYIVTDFYESEKQGIPGYYVKMKNLDTGVFNEERFVVDNQSLGLFAELYKEKIAFARQYGGKAWREVAAFKSNFLIMRDVKSGEAKLCSKDLDYGYAMTIHKLQGSTYPVVLVNGTDIDKNGGNKDRERENRTLWYVSASRVNKLAVFGLI